MSKSMKDEEAKGMNDPQEFEDSNTADDTFYLEKLDKYPGELPNQDEVDHSDATMRSKQSSVDMKGENAMNNKAMNRKIFLYSAIGALIILLAAMIYDWGINRDGLNDINKIFAGGDEESVDKFQTDKVKIEEEEIYDKMPESKGEEYIIIEEELIGDEPPTRKPEKKSKSSISRSQKKQYKDDSFKEDGGYSSQEKKRSSDIEGKKIKDDDQYAASFGERIKRSDAPENHRIYTVQVYTTPSKEDADEWKSKLEAMNIENVVISKHLVRDKDWYRVRFGAFKTEEEAKKQALKYGFAQSWVDRIR